jgi:two-component system alkaline phosphatase synthesis response regulator PhoP
MERAKILIADDEAHIIHVVQLKLQNGGFDVVTAMDGREALELVRRERPQLLISDLQMPVLSGLELAAALYQDPQTRYLPIILLTAKGFEVDAEATARTNVRMIMTKPFSPRELLARVNELMEQPAGVC